jgi:HAD superfamily hydrolase (TIGR01459 family)
MKRGLPMTAPVSPELVSAVPPAVTGIGGLADRYDGFIVDLWGCVHDGLKPFPGVIDALMRLKARGKRVLALSNAPRRAEAVVAGFAKLGIAAELFDAVLSSGEAAWQAFARRGDPWHAALGRHGFHIGPPRNAGMFEGNGLVRVAGLGMATFVLVTGPQDDSLDIAAHEDLLQAVRARGLKMVCANPDLEVLRGPARLICAGALAQRYAVLGGDVRHHGKPDPAIYDAGLELLGIADRSRVLAIGDGLRTDIAGAAAARIDSAWIPGGIHGVEFGIEMGALPAPDAAARLAARFGALPTYLIPELRW